MFNLAAIPSDSTGNSTEQDVQEQVVRHGTTNHVRGRFSNETTDQRERRLQANRERNRRRRQQRTSEQREQLLAQRRQARQEKTEEQRNRRLEYQRQYRQGRRELESIQHREVRLNLHRLHQGTYLNNETPEQRERRLQGFQQNTTDRIQSETEQQRTARLQRVRQNTADRIQSETEQQRTARLQRVRQNTADRIQSETEQQQTARLQRVRQNTADRIQTETEQQQTARLQRVRQNTADRIQSETEQQQTARLQRVRQNTADRIQSETEQQRTARLQRVRQNTADRIQSETEDTRIQRLQLLRQNYTDRLLVESTRQRQDRLQLRRESDAARLQLESEEERNIRLQSARENSATRRQQQQLQQQQQELNRDDCLSNGWRDTDQPLHKQQWVQNEMKHFHTTMNSFQHQQCITRKETWPTKQTLPFPNFQCLRCKRDKGNPKLFSQENDMDPGAVPLELQGLTEIEEMLIARACPIMCVYRKHGGQRGYKGHVLNLPQDIKGFLTKLPANVNELPYLIIRRHGAENTHRDCKVRREKVLQAITWLKENNPFYADIEIDYEALQRLPVDGITSDLPTTDDPQQDVQQDNETRTIEESPQNISIENQHDSHSFIPLPQAQQSEQHAIRALINGEDPLEWPSNDGQPINEFQTEGLATMAFPTLFPHGKGDPTKKTRLREVSLTEGFKHLIKYADLSPLQTFTWRFASHPRFPYWALNMKKRHQLLSQARIYLTQNPQDANLTTEELREMVQQMSAQQLMNRLQRYVAKIQGTRQYWHQRYQELKALITQKGAPTFFFTFSAADNYWPDLHRLLQEPEDPTPSIRIKAVIDHPHLTDSYFVTRLEEFCTHWLDNVLGTEWKWLRYEWQARGSIHAHGCAKLNNDPGLCNLVKVVAFGWKLQQILRLHEEQPSHQELADDYRIHIDEGNQAQAKVIEYVDWLVTTINESLPQENWNLPSPHPSALPFQRIENEDSDYHALVNSVERHTKCSTAYCIKVKPGQPPACRFNYPKECQENTSIDFQLIVKGCDDDRELTADEIANARVKETITTKRNDDRINSHNHVMLQH